MSDVLVKVEGVSKKFCRSLKRSLWYGMRDIGGEIVGARRDNVVLRPDEFWAVKDASFELTRGQCLGLVGRNGAGKTTLLKMLNGLIKPDEGRIELRGRVGALIALGAGFNPILTGRQNIYVNASVLGLTKRETEAKLDEIIDFAGVREFVDTPVQSYSSGMQVRLGFAIATAVEPDVLLLDEVLAVGDAAFRQKCYNTIGRLVDRCAVIFVSHSMDQVAYISSRVAVMDRGRIVACGDPPTGIATYERLNEEGPDDDTFISCEAPLQAFGVSVPGKPLRFADSLRLCFRLRSSGPIASPVLRVQFYSDYGVVCAESFVELDGQVAIDSGTTVFDVLVGPVHLKRGRYRLSILLYGRNRQIVHGWDYKTLSIAMDGDAWGHAAYRLPARVFVVSADAVSASE